MWLSKYFVDFVIFSCMGWIYESTFCTIKGRKWENRGFLYGPVCPIYGAGAIACEILIDLFKKPGVEYSYTWWQIFIIAFFGSIVLEYTTSWVLEKLFHAYWWDYSDMPLNIKGRVCFPCSVGFGFAGILVVYVILPFTSKMTGWMSPIVTELFGLIFMAVIAADTTLTVSALTQFAKSVEAAEAAWNAHMDTFVKNVQEGKYAPENMLEGGKKAAGAMLESKKQAFTARLAEERERFSKERMEQSYASMGAGTRMALNRVQGFRPRKGEKKLEGQKGEFTITVRMNRALDEIKSRVSRKNK